MDADKAAVHETCMRARQMYLAGAPVKDILAATGFTSHRFYDALKGGPHVAPGQRMLPEIKAGRIMRRRPRPSRRASLVVRLWKSAAREVRQIDRRLRQAGVDPAQRERDARLMAVMVKTMRELAILDQRDADKASHDERLPDRDGDMRDIDEFRRDLARRIEALVAERSGEAAGGDGGR